MTFFSLDRMSVSLFSNPIYILRQTYKIEDGVRFM
jgi:hypothetical protein